LLSWIAKIVICFAIQDSKIAIKDSKSFWIANDAIKLSRILKDSKTFSYPG
jgi:hypothetical protein